MANLYIAPIRYPPRWLAVNLPFVIPLRRALRLRRLHSSQLHLEAFLASVFFRAFFVLVGTCNFTASFARPTAAFASRSCCWTAGESAEYRSITSEIRSSTWLSRRKAFVAFMTTPLGQVLVCAVALRRLPASSPHGPMDYAVSTGAAFFAAAFFLAGAAFFVAAFAAARRRAHIFLLAAIIAARPAALNFRLAFGAATGAGAAGSASPLIFAYLAFCARDILRRAAAENFLRFPGASDAVESGVTAVGEEPSLSMARSSAIWPSM
jgi:hypothetical protein